MKAARRQRARRPPTRTVLRSRWLSSATTSQGSESEGPTLTAEIQAAASGTRPYLSSRRTTSSSCGVETSMICASSMASNVWTTPGWLRHVSPGPSSWAVIASAESPCETITRPDRTYEVSSFSSWNWTERRQPAMTRRIFPAYLSVCANHSSLPHGFGTSRGRLSSMPQSFQRSGPRGSEASPPW